MMECPVQCGRNAHATPGFFSMAGTAVKASGMGARRPVDVCFARTGVERRRSSPMPQAAFYGDWGVSPTSRKSLSCHESPACRRVVLN